MCGLQRCAAAARRGRARNWRWQIRNWRTSGGGQPPRWPAAHRARSAQVLRRACTCGALAGSRNDAWHVRCDYACRDAAWVPRSSTNVTRPRRTSHRGNAVPTSQEDVMNLVKSFMLNEEGQDLLEYALLVALIALVAVCAGAAGGGGGGSHLQHHPH